MRATGQVQAAPSTSDDQQKQPVTVLLLDERSSDPGRGGAAA